MSASPTDRPLTREEVIDRLRNNRAPAIFEAANDAADMLEREAPTAQILAAYRLTDDVLRRLLVEAVDGLEPFALIKPSSFYPNDGSDGDVYEINLVDDPPDKPDLSGRDLATARALVERIRTTLAGESK